MKKRLMIISSIIILGCSTLFAQSDGFFTYSDGGETNRSTSWGVEVTLPTSHGLTAHQSAEAPLGSGLLLLAGLALGYAVRKHD